MVTIMSYAEDQCIWCGKTKEGVEITTDDRSFVGFFCIPDLRRMLRLKSSGHAVKRKPESPAAHPESSKL